MQEFIDFLEQNHKLKVYKQNELGGENKNSNNLTLDTDKGKFLLRRYISISKDKAQQIIDILRFCKNELVPRPVEPGLFEYKGNIYCLFHYIEGEHFQGTPEEISSLARGLAKLHKKLATYQGPIPENTYTLITTKELAQSKTSQNPLIIQNLPFIEQTLAKLPPITLPTQPIHRDLHPANVLFHKHHLTGIIDLDAIEIGEKMRDVAFCAFRFSEESSPQIIHTFLTEYERHNEISHQEKEQFWSLLIHESLRRISLILRQEQQGDTTWLHDLDKHLNHIKIFQQLETKPAF